MIQEFNKIEIEVVAGNFESDADGHYDLDGVSIAYGQVIVASDGKTYFEFAQRLRSEGNNSYCGLQI